jgi:hypothetical protein
LTLTHSQLHKTSGAQVWRSAAATTATGILAFGWTWSLGYGLDFLLGFCLFLLGALPLEKGVLALVGYWSATGIILSVKVKVLGGGLCAYGWVTILLYCLWKNKHISFILTNMGIAKDNREVVKAQFRREGGARSRGEDVIVFLRLTFHNALIDLIFFCS